MKLCRKRQVLAALVFTGLLTAMVGALSIRAMFPQPTARLRSNDYEVVGLSRDNWYALLNWTTWMGISGVVSSVALLVLFRTPTQEPPAAGGSGGFRRRFDT